MTRFVYLKAFAIDKETAPAFCKVPVANDTVSRIRNLAQMSYKFGIERLGDHFPVIWESQSFMSRHYLLGPSLYVNASECWWVTPYLNGSCSHGFHTERLNVSRFARMLDHHTNDFAWSEDDSTLIALQQAMRCVTNKDLVTT